jgi:hypothetical protein
MKIRILCKPRMALAVMVLCSQTAPVLLAQNSSPAPASAEAAAPASASETRSVQLSSVQLSSGVPEILKLGRGHVGDEVIIAFIMNSGRMYHLSASEILYLREQGVSDQVLTAMLSAGQNAAATSAQPAAQAVPQPAPQPAPTAPTSDWANSSPPPAPAATQFAPAYDAAAPVYAQPSPVYAYPAPYYGYYDYWPYYLGYPALSFGFGFGGGHYGGYHGGGYRGGGGYHGGGGGHR